MVSIYNMWIDHHFYSLMITGLITGMVASFIGGGAEILIVPLLLYLRVFDDYKSAVGTSLASLLLPIGIVAVYFYYNTKCNSKPCIQWNYAFIISLFFVIGTFLSYFTVKIDNKIFKMIFAIFMITLGIGILIEDLY
uniref:Membrane transporter protein n=1 Tax=viral metagenome TaxID=1070528 RepID=A0A6C0CNF3_9ZZZZ